MSFHDFFEDNGMAILGDRFLGTTNATDMVANATAPSATSEDLSSRDDGTVLLNTLTVYGTIFGVMFILFCILRRYFQSVYNVRQWSPNVMCNLANDQHGWISWFWKNRNVSEDVMLAAVGMDALCLLRILDFGLRVTMVGIFNSLWLMPIYAVESIETAEIRDRVVKVSVAHVPDGNRRLIATAVAAWILFGYAMYQIIQDFKWFTVMRNKYLSTFREQNYSVYVRGIPPELRYNQALREYFCEVFSESEILEARVGVYIPKLEKQVAKREKLVENLEHAMNICDIKGIRPKHLDLVQGRRVDSIDTYSKELEELNKEISNAIVKIENMQSNSKIVDDLEKAVKGAFPTITEGDEETHISDASPAAFQKFLKGGTRLTNDLTRVVIDANTFVMGEVNVNDLNPVKAIHDIGKTSKELLLGAEDGLPRESGFVTFTRLTTAQAALQMIHHPSPYTMYVEEAPKPDDIYWKNVGKAHRDITVGRLLGNVWTILLCVFWTVPVAFIVSLGSVNVLKKKIPFLAKMVDAMPFIEPLLKQVSPLLLLGLNSALPMILELFGKLEGPISTSVLMSKVFVKLSIFLIIQTFFVVSISANIADTIAAWMENPQEIISFLAATLPSQSTYFVQLLLVSTFLGMGFELLRVIPVIKATIRRFVGPNLTQKERNKPFMGLNPLSNPQEFEFANTCANAIIYFMVSFVYSPMSPVTSYFMAFCYILLGAGYRHQFIHIYPNTPDSGGKVWTGFISIVQTCMLIVELTLVGYLGIKKAPAGALLMVPLIITTLLFNFYIRQEHFRVATFLPSSKAHTLDNKNEEEGCLPIRLLEGAYVQPALKIKEIHPETMELQEAQKISQLGKVEDHESMNDYDRGVSDTKWNANEAFTDMYFLTPSQSEAEVISDESAHSHDSFCSSVAFHNQL